MRHFHIFIIVLLIIALSAFAQSQNYLENRFGWELSGGKGSWQIDPETGEECLTVQGTGKEGDTNYWRLDYPFEPNTAYKLSVKVRTGTGATGTHILIGSNLVNRDVWVKGNWEKKEFVFETPEKTAGSYLKFGQWRVRGTVWFRNIQIHPVQPVYIVQNDYKLGSGERIRDGVYEALSNFKGYESNFARYHYRHDAYFNTNRYDLYLGDYVIFRHEIGDGAKNQSSGTVKINVAYYVDGQCTVEASVDGARWVAVGSIRAREQRTFSIPKVLYPTDEIYIRLRATGDNARMQIYNYEYQATLNRKSADLVGSTQFINIMQQDKDVAVQFESLGSVKPGKRQSAVVKVQNKTNRAQTYEIDFDADGKRARKTVRIDAGKSVNVEVPVENEISVSSSRKLSVKRRGAWGEAFVAQANIQVPYLELEDYGNLLYSSEKVGLWWTDAVRKIGKYRDMPKTGKSDAIQIHAARNEYEAAQLVLRAEQPLKNVRATVSDLKGKNGIMIPADHVQILMVDYVPVKVSSDAVGMPAEWPDPLPELEGSFSVAQGQNQPLWIQIKIPADAAAGDYEGAIELQAQDWTQAVPVELHVWDFALPEETHVKTSFGFAPQLVRLYHHLKNEAQMRQVIDKYYQSFADHRITPYDPFYGASVKKTVDKRSLSVRLDFSKFDRIATRNLDKYNFNTFRMNIDGLGSGTFHA
ncbi:hypothetical protein GF337_06415, partial [candidate division KSB1 bacterium]|nr:hypothetical protein [candidate division KSB1 bacterium]